MDKNKAKRFKQLLRLGDKPFPALLICHAERFLADYPEYGPAWLLLSVPLTELGRYQEAKQALEKAFDLCPDRKRHFVLAHMGDLFREWGDYDQAVEWYRKAVEAEPDDAGSDNKIFLGCMLAKQGRFQEAEEVHRAATQCQEGCIDEAYLNLGFVLRAMERFEEASECFREAINLDPKYRVAKQALRDVEQCIAFKGE